MNTNSCYGPQNMDLWHNANHTALASPLKKLMPSLDISLSCSLKINRHGKMTHGYAF